MKSHSSTIGKNLVEDFKSRVIERVPIEYLPFVLEHIDSIHAQIDLPALAKVKNMEDLDEYFVSLHKSQSKRHQIGGGPFTKWVFSRLSAVTMPARVYFTSLYISLMTYENDPEYIEVLNKNEKIADNMKQPLLDEIKPFFNIFYRNTDFQKTVMHGFKGALGDFYQYELEVIKERCEIYASLFRSRVAQKVKENAHVFMADLHYEADRNGIAFTENMRQEMMNKLKTSTVDTKFFELPLIQVQLILDKIENYNAAFGKRFKETLALPPSQGEYWMRFLQSPCEYSRRFFMDMIRHVTPGDIVLSIICVLLMLGTYKVISNQVYPRMYRFFTTLQLPKLPYLSKTSKIIKREVKSQKSQGSPKNRVVEEKSQNQMPTPYMTISRSSPKHNIEDKPLPGSPINMSITRTPEFSKQIECMNRFSHTFAEKEDCALFAKRFGESLLRYCLSIFRYKIEDIPSFTFRFQDSDKRTYRFLQIGPDLEKGVFHVKIDSSNVLKPSVHDVRHRLMDKVASSFNSSELDDDSQRVRFVRNAKENHIVVAFGSNEHWMRKAHDDGWDIVFKELLAVCKAIGMLFIHCMMTNKSLSKFLNNSIKNNRTLHIDQVMEKYDGELLIENWRTGMQISSIDLGDVPLYIGNTMRKLEASEATKSYLFSFMWNLYNTKLNRHKQKSKPK